MAETSPEGSQQPAEQGLPEAEEGSSTVLPESAPESPRESWITGQRGAWIGAGGTVIAAVIAVLAVYLPHSDSSGTAAAPPQSTTSNSSAGTARGEQTSGSPVPATNTTTTVSTSTGPPAVPSVRWQGKLLFDGSAKDMDTIPPTPASTGRGADFGTGGISDELTLDAILGGATASVWDDGGTPSYAQCAETVETLGTSEQPLTKGAFLCFETDQGRIGRLQVLAFPRSYGPYVEFNTVVWERAGSNELE